MRQKADKNVLLLLQWPIGCTTVVRRPLSTTTVNSVQLVGNPEVIRQW